MLQEAFNRLENNLAGPLPPDLAKIFRARARPLRVRRGQIIIAEGTTSTDVYYIVSGRMQVSMMSISGRETIFRDVGGGQLIGEIAAIDGHSRSASVVALEDSVIACLPAAGFRAYLSEVPEAGYWMTQQLTALVRDLSNKAMEMAALPVGGRLIAELLRLPCAVGANSDGRTVLNMPTHAELASRIGTHRETVTREIKSLTDLGLVKQTGRALTIVSIERLQNMLDQHYR